MDSLFIDEKTLTELDKLRDSGRRIIFTNGCFDILHVGHIRYLSQARQLGDILVVGVNSDASVRRLKGSGRPICPLEERREVLMSLRMVDAVVAFEEDTPIELIHRIRPMVLVKGGDWPVDKIVGADVVRSYGGDVRSLPFVEGKSTTDIVERIRALDRR